MSTKIKIWIVDILILCLLLLLGFGELFFSFIVVDFVNTLDEKCDLYSFVNARQTYGDTEIYACLPSGCVCLSSVWLSFTGCKS